MNMNRTRVTWGSWIKQWTLDKRAVLINRASIIWLSSCSKFDENESIDDDDVDDDGHYFQIMASLSKKKLPDHQPNRWKREII